MRTRFSTNQSSKNYIAREPPPRKTIVTAQNNEILTKMRARVRRTRQVEPRRRLVDYRSENNRTAIRRRIRYRNKMNFKKRKLKKWKSQKLLKKCLKRAYCRDLIIDPLPDLDCEVFGKFLVSYYNILISIFT